MQRKTIPLWQRRMVTSCCGCGESLARPAPASRAYCNSCWGLSFVRTIVQEANDLNRRRRGGV